MEQQATDARTVLDRQAARSCTVRSRAPGPARALDDGLQKRPTAYLESLRQRIDTLWAECMKLRQHGENRAPVIGVLIPPVECGATGDEGPQSEDADFGLGEGLAPNGEHRTANKTEARCNEPVRELS